MSKTNNRIKKLKPGDRVRHIRELIGLSQQEFCEALELDFNQLRNIEYKRNRVTEEFYETIGEAFPELLPWFVYEGNFTIEDLRNSKSELCKVAAARLRAGLIQPGHFPDQLFKS